jgi:hypothetical protein
MSQSRISESFSSQYHHVHPSAAFLTLPGPNLTINCPASFVLKTLSDTSTWPSWNSFVPKCEILSNISDSTATNIDTSESVSSVLREGDIVAFNVAMDPSKPFKISRRDIHLIHKASKPDDGKKEEYFIGWIDAPKKHGGFSPSLMKFEHLWRITKTGDEYCEVEHWNLLAGWLSYPTKWFIGGALGILHERQGRELKGFCEGEWKKESEGRK